MIEWLSRRKVLVLFAINGLLAGVLLPVYDPFDWNQSGYEGAESLLSLPVKRIRSLRIVHPGGHRAALIFDEEEGTWRLKTDYSDPGREKADQQIYLADQKRVQELLEVLQDLRMYYSIDATPETKVRYGLQADESGQCPCIRLEIDFMSGKKQSLLAGKANALSGESYIMQQGDDSIYHVRGNVVRALGAGQKDFFRNRDFFLSGSFMTDPENDPPESPNLLRPALEDIVSFVVKLRRGPRIEISRTGDQWTMTAPSSGPVRKSAFESLLKEILGWRIQSFLDIHTSKGPEGLPSRDDLDQTRAMEIVLVVREGVTGKTKIRLNVLGELDFGNYLVRHPGKGHLVEITSLSLERLFEPGASHYLETQQVAPGRFTPENRIFPGQKP